MMKKITVVLMAVLGISLMLGGCRASGEVGDTSSSIAAPR
jgi:hypothetical protein